MYYLCIIIYIYIYYIYIKPIFWHIYAVNIIYFDEDCHGIQDFTIFHRKQKRYCNDEYFLC